MAVINFDTGSVVRVRNGEPMPPAKFTKKLAAWRKENFDGVLIAEVGGRLLFQRLGATLSAMAGGPDMIWLINEPALSVTLIDLKAPRYPVCPQKLTVSFRAMVATDTERLRVVQQDDGRKVVHSFLDAAFFSGANIDIDQAEDLVRNAEIIADVPDRFRAMRHALGRRCPKSGRGIYLETKETTMNEMAEELINEAKRDPLRVSDADAMTGRIAFLMNGRDLPMDDGTAWNYILAAPGCVRLFKVIGRGKRKGIKLEPLEADGRKVFNCSQGCVVLSQGNVALLPEQLLTPEALALGRVIIRPLVDS